MPIFSKKDYFIITEFNQFEWVFDISNGKGFIMWLFNGFLSLKFAIQLMWYFKLSEGQRFITERL